MLDKLLDFVSYIAPRLRAGTGHLVDPDCLTKLAAERAELALALQEGDDLAAVMECADICYYIGKAVLNGLMTRTEATQALAGLPYESERILWVLRAKYNSRILHGKDDARERSVTRMWMEA